jgi:electron transfer flavoprotein alpha subunit
LTSGILVSSESDDGAHELLTKGRELSRAFGTEVSALMIGQRDEKSAQSYFDYGARKVLSIPSISLDMLDAETYTQALFEVAKEGPDILLISSTRLGKETAGRVAQKLQAGCITDSIGLTAKGSDIIIDRYALGGNTISSEMITTKKKVISVMPRSFEAHLSPVTGRLETISFNAIARRVAVVERKRKIGESVSIVSAERLICVGQGIAKKEDLTIVNEFCSAVKAELGCTRALSADYHWISEDRMVGISGKRCKPKLHISIGISGQIQHTVGIMGSKLIVAINKDKEAPIFKIADYGIVGDLYQVLPKLTERICSLRT